jgi:hypothetical protein
MHRRIDALLEHRALVEQELRDGRHVTPEGTDLFTTAYFHHPDELRDELEHAGFVVDTVLAVEGPGSFRPELDGWLDDAERRDVLLRAIRRVEAEPTALGASAHLLAFARA